MGRKVILDTTALIDYERSRFDQASLDEDDIAIASITVAEFRTGIELADTPQRATHRARHLAAILEFVEVLDYTQGTAVTHAELLAHTRKTGQPRGAHDLIIAAHAAHTGRILLSRDANAKYQHLPGVFAEQI